MLVMRAELLGKLGLVSAVADRGDLEAHVASVLDPEVAEPAYTEHRDEIASLRRRIAQSAEGREAGAEQRRRIDRREIIRHAFEWFSPWTGDLPRRRDEEKV